MQIVIFDLDGTLVDTAPDIIDALNRTLDGKGLPPVDDATGRRFIGGGARQLVADGIAHAAGEAEAEGEIDRAYDKFIAFYTERSVVHSAPYPGVRETLEELSLAGLPMGVCTNKPQALSVDVLNGLDLMDHFRTVVGGDALPERKPAPHHLIETANRVAPDYTAAVLIGDSPTDVATARNARIPIVAVDYGYTDVPAPQLGADAVISDMRELPALLPALLATA